MIVPHFSLTFQSSPSVSLVHLCKLLLKVNCICFSKIFNAYRKHLDQIKLPEINKMFSITYKIQCIFKKAEVLFGLRCDPAISVDISGFHIAPFYGQILFRTVRYYSYEHYRFTVETQCNVKVFCRSCSWYISSMETTESEKRQDAIRNIIYYYTNIINGVRDRLSHFILCSRTLLL